MRDGTGVVTVTPHERRMRELEAMRGVVADLEALVTSSTVGTVPATDVADVFERHISQLPKQSQVLQQFERIAAGLKTGPARTRVEGIRQIALKLRRKADDFARVVEARDARLRTKDSQGGAGGAS
jgi:hypothetical protein